MAGLTPGPGDEVTEVEEWTVTWFPPDAAERRKTYVGEQEAEKRARRYARRDGVRQWHPLLEHRITTTIVVSEIVPL